MYYLKKVVFLENTADIDLCIARKCKNLALHKGGFSQIMSFIFEGHNLYLHDKLFDGFHTKYLKNFNINPVIIN